MTKICETCGKEFEVDPHKTGIQNNCPECSIHVVSHKKKHGNKGNVYERKAVKSTRLREKPTDCICPRCGKHHKKYGVHKWSYCHDCDVKLKHTYSDAYGIAM
jgi:DNA-directed RNA polymerase subunit RPC12/RpoP